MPPVIYGLFDPRKTTDLENCRYIGQCTRDERLTRRLREHIREAVLRNGNWPVHFWIRKLNRDGVKPIVVILERCWNKGIELDVREIAWIASGRLRRWPLLNVTNGGSGWLDRGPLSSEHREKIGEASRRSYAEDSTLSARISASLLEHYQDPAAREKLSVGKIAKYDADPEYRQRVSEGGKRSYADNPDRGQHISDMVTQRFSDPAERERMSEILTEVYKNPEIRKRISSSVSAFRATEDKTPSWCPVCESGPFVGLRGMRLHQTQKGCANNN